jgi:co-chaperonin GroES (HSP10)
MDNSAETVVSISGEEAATQLPEPSGASILCAVPDIDTQFDNGILKSEETKRNEEILCVVYFVVALGPDCYGETEKFPSGPYCKKGDFVLVAAHTGVQVSIHGKAFRIIYDDQVRSVVQDPRGIQR